MTATTKRILVTGASGFIGGHACEALVKTGAKVRAMVRKTSNVGQLAGTGVEICHADLSDPASLQQACADVDTVVHTAAAVGSFGDWEHFHEVGVLGTERLIDAAHRRGVSRFIHVSSIAAYGLKDHRRRVDEDTPFDHAPQPWNHYVREKVMSEEVLWRAHEAQKIRATSLRPSVVVGARDRNAVPRLVDLLRLPVTALPGRPDNHFPVVTIEDCVDAIVRSVENEAAIGRAYNVSGGRRITIADFFALIAKHAQLPPPKLYLPTGLMLPATGLLESAWKLLGKAGEPVATRIAIVVSGYDYEIDCRRAQRELGWSADGSYEAAIVAALEQPSETKHGLGTVASAGSAERSPAVAANH
ncbi:MAG: NAD-dependent epimerase/dehydratase family protein [Minicystis sp.]